MPVTKRLSFAGSIASPGSTHSSRLPLPLVSSTNGAQPCARCSSPVSSNSLRLSQPITGLAEPPALVHSVLFASSANARWCVLKQVLISVNLPLAGSNIERWRLAFSSGSTSAEGWLEPLRQNSGLRGARTRAVYQTRPRSSSIGLCVVVWLVPIDALPPDPAGALRGSPDEGVSGYRTGGLLSVSACFAGRTP